MSNDGFRAAVKIDKIELCAGKYKSRSAEKATMEMTGIIYEYDDADFSSRGHYSKDKKTYVHMLVEFHRIPDYSLCIPDELIESCVGRLVVKVRESHDPDSFDDFDIRADIHLILGWNMFDTLCAMREHTLVIDPVFYREEGQKEKK